MNSKNGSFRSRSVMDWNEHQCEFGFHETQKRRSRKFDLYLFGREEGHQTISLKRIEAARITMIRYLRRRYPESLRSFLKIRVWKIPRIPETKKALGARMGKGKGPISRHVVLLERKRKVPRYQILVPSRRKRDVLLRQCRRRREKKLGAKVGVCSM